MDLHDRDEAGIQVVCLRLFGVENLHWVGSARDGEDGSLKEVLGELDGIQGGGGHDELHVFALQHRLREKKRRVTCTRSAAPEDPMRGEVFLYRGTVPYLLQQAEEHVSVDGPLVGLVQHDESVLTHVWVDETLPLQHAVGHVLDDGLGAGAVLKSNGVPHLKWKEGGDR